MIPEEASTRAKTQDYGGYTEGKPFSIEEEDTVVPSNIKFETTTEKEPAQDCPKEAVERIKASEETDETAPPASNDQPSWHQRGGSQGQARPQPGQSQAAEAADSPLSQPLSRGAETKAPPPPRCHICDVKGQPTAGHWTQHCSRLNSGQKNNLKAKHVCLGCLRWKKTGQNACLSSMVV